MQPPVPDLSGFPVWAQVLMYSILGISIAVTFVFTWLGYLKGKNNVATPTNQAQVAAVIVDPTALIAAKDAILDLTRNVSNLTEAIEKMTLEMVRNSGGNHRR